MFTEAVEEFFKCFLDKINNVVTSEDKDVQVSIHSKVFNLLFRYNQC